MAKVKPKVKSKRPASQRGSKREVSIQHIAFALACIAAGVAIYFYQQPTLSAKAPINLEIIQAGNTTADRVLALSNLISPVATQDYWYNYTEQKALHIQRHHGYYSGLNTSLADIDHLLSLQAIVAQKEELLHPTTKVSQARCSWVKHGMDSQNEHYASVHQAYLDGCTVVCHLVPAYWPPLARLMYGMQRETGLNYMANMYLTPAASQGFIEHTDNKDGIILQMHGSKHWVIKTSKFPNPLRYQTFGRPGQLPAADIIDQDVMDQPVQAGDMLLVPRGFVHYARTTGENSLHFTISAVSASMPGLFRHFRVTGSDSLLRAFDPIAVCLEHSNHNIERARAQSIRFAL
eukprot:TRINITY_DN8875_c0_g1_i4.p1 TRINITY_DN8875_c0_g1~~TRINITY_DN8875_c0_g1_i4.p1  ORF type:complete len:360 (+),score=51.06 TRINITY_DN8875_c0_g1_i4:39-1082(+)